LATPREEGSKLFILIDGAKRISHLHARVAAGKGGASNPLGFLGNQIDGASV
jgi:hypothetical protein